MPTNQPTNLRQQPDSSRSSHPDPSSKESFQVSAPSISLPKGGGVIRGIGEKFGANPVTGTGSMTVPIATSPGRSGFGPHLSLSYDSGAEELVPSLVQKDGTREKAAFERALEGPSRVIRRGL